MKKHSISLVLLILIVGLATSQVHEWRKIALEYMEVNQPDKALPFYRQAVSLDPVNGVLRAELAYAYQLVGEYDIALEDYTLALGLSNAPITDIKYNMGLIFSYKQQWQEAMKLFNEVLDLDQEYTNAYLNRAIVETHLQKYRNAEKDYKIVLVLEPEHTQKIEIEEMLAVLMKLRDFPEGAVDKSKYNEKLALEEELNNQRERLEDKAVNRYLGQ